MRLLKGKGGEEKYPSPRPTMCQPQCLCICHLIDCPPSGVVGSLTFCNSQDGLDWVQLKRKLLVICWEGDREVKESHKSSYRSKKGT